MKRKKRLRIAAYITLGILIIITSVYLFYGYAPTPDEPQLTSTSSRDNIKVGKMTRTFISYIPKKITVKPALIIVLHGTNIDGAKIRAWTGYEFDQMADKYGFLVSYPDGYDHDWNDCRKGQFSKTKKENVDDLDFIKELVNYYQIKCNIDPDKVYLFGYSSGGIMAFSIGMREPGMVAGIATISAALPTAESSTCGLNGKMPRVMLVNGTADRICPIEGGELNLFGRKLGHILSARATAGQFAASNNIATDPVKTQLPHLSPDDPTYVDRYVWSANGKSMVELFTVNNGGHVVPQPVAKFPRILGRIAGDFNAPEAAIAFFGLQL